MKCICGYESYPNNARVFANHVQDCMVDGPCKDLMPVPTIVWRDKGFTVVREAAEGEQTYDLGIVRHKTVEELAAENAGEVIVETPTIEAEPTEE